MNQEKIYYIGIFLHCNLRTWLCCSLFMVLVYLGYFWSLIMFCYIYIYIYNVSTYTTSTTIMLQILQWLPSYFLCMYYRNFFSWDIRILSFGCIIMYGGNIISFAHRVPSGHESNDSVYKNCEAEMKIFRL